MAETEANTTIVRAEKKDILRLRDNQRIESIYLTIREIQNGILSTIEVIGSTDGNVHLRCTDSLYPPRLGNHGLVAESEGTLRHKSSLSKAIRDAGARILNSAEAPFASPAQVTEAKGLLSHVLGNNIQLRSPPGVPPAACSRQVGQGI